MWRKRAKRIGQSAIAMFVVLLAIVLARTASLRSRQPSVAGSPEEERVDANAVAAHLAGAVQAQTVSVSTSEPAPAAALAALRASLEQSFPKVHAALTREVVGEHALLYTWKGSGGDALRPLILCAHQDVVPIEAGTAESWHEPPFSGKVAGGFVWGRGTLDDKGSLVTILEAVEALLRDGFTPARTIYLAFGHDEESAGAAGAGKIVDLLASRGVRAEAALDEGNPVIAGIVPSIAGSVAPIGIAEKGYLTLTLAVDLPGGHSSTPGAESALSVLGDAIARLRSKPMPARLDGATLTFFEWAAPEMSFGQRMVLANTWLTWPLVQRLFSASPALDASIRTTTAVTVLRAGVKDNVIPRTAEAQVNFRVLPGDTTEGVIAHVGAAIADGRVRLEAQAATRTEPSRISSAESRAFTAIATAVREVFPGTTVAPALMLAATDGRKYERVADDVYRFLPVALVAEDLHRLHGTDERIALAALPDAVRFYRRLVQTMGTAAGGAPQAR